MTSALVISANAEILNFLLLVFYWKIFILGNAKIDSNTQKKYLVVDRNNQKMLFSMMMYTNTWFMVVTEPGRFRAVPKKKKKKKIENTTSWTRIESHEQQHLHQNTHTSFLFIPKSPPFKGFKLDCVVFYLLGFYGIQIVYRMFRGSSYYLGGCYFNCSFRFNILIFS